MTPETEVISCPACKHLLRVPADWLGTQVQCPECRAMFKAPVRDGDRLTEPELISAPTDSPAAPRPRGKLDPMLLIPAFGLLLLGVISLIVNGFTLVQIAQDAAGFEEAKRVEARALAQKFGMDPQNIGLNKLTWQFFAAMSGWGAFCGLVSFLGGLGISMRRWRRVAQVGCVLAALNFAGGCCIPGFVFGLWGMLMLMSSEGRAHFGR